MRRISKIVPIYVKDDILLEVDYFWSDTKDEPFNDVEYELNTKPRKIMEAINLLILQLNSHFSRLKVTSMSYDLYLKDPVTKKTINLDRPHFMRGGTYCIQGDNEAHINITYNYAPVFQKVLGENGIRSLYGLSGVESIPKIKYAISQLDNDVNDDYWQPTEGNVKQSLYQCLALAAMHPEGIWDGD